jgi:lipopolysaccharide transport system permease protein
MRAFEWSHQMNCTAIQREYWIKAWHARHFLMCMVQIDLRNRYKRSILGVGWALLQPILMATVLCTVFSQMFHLDLRDYAPFVLAGLGIWAFLSYSITEGCNTLYSSEKYIRSQPLPMALYAMRTLFGVGLQFLIITGLAFLVTLVLRGYSQPVALLSLIPSVLILAVFGWSMAVIFGFINVHFPDTMHISGVLLQITYFLTPVFYPPEQISSPLVRSILYYNPLAAFVNIVREPLVYCRLPTVEHFMIAGISTTVFMLLAVWMLVKRERTIIFHM